MANQIKKSILWGVGSATALTALYFSILSLVSGWDFTQSQFSENWYWIIALSSGFGAQIALFTYLRVLHRGQVSAKVVVASGTTSTIAMISCCAHYLVNILPVIGISGLIAVIGQYQTELFWVGIVSNLLGIIYMTNKLIKFKSARLQYE
mgnify:CR=1 FL=1